MEMKFFKLFDILHPAMVRWPEWRKYLVVYVSMAQAIWPGLFCVYSASTIASEEDIHLVQQSLSK